MCASVNGEGKRAAKIVLNARKGDGGKFVIVVQIEFHFALDPAGVAPVERGKDSRANVLSLAVDAVNDGVNLTLGNGSHLTVASVKIANVFRQLG